MADSKRSGPSMSTFVAFLLVVYFMFSSQVDADLLVNPTLIKQELQSIATDALGVDKMQAYFERLQYRDQPISENNIIDLAVKLRQRFTRRFDIAKRLQKAVEESYSRTMSTAPQKKCCQVNKSTLTYDARFRSKVNLNTICLKISGHAPKNPGYLDDRFLKETKAISEEHSFVKWQYFGSEEGVMTNFPTYDDTEPCDRYDPRYRPFYVETATPEAKDVVLVMDTSWSMTGDKLDVAQEAAKTVLDTMNPKDQVGIVSFVDDVKTPDDANCYSEQLALAIPANIRNLKDFVDEQHASPGQTKFIPAFEKAFELLKGSVSNSPVKSRKRVILFLTDGDPSDSKEDLFKIIRDRNLELNNSVIILTYGFDRAYQEILIDIANQNTSKYGVPANTSVGDIARGSYTYVEDIRTLRSKMATYYALFAEQLSRPVVSVPYVDAFGTGLLVSVTLPCYHQGKFIGVTGTDINIEDLMPDILEFIKQGRTTYVFMINTSGRTLIHPLLPTPADAYGDPIYMDIRNLEQPESEFKGIFDSMTRGMKGSKSLVATRYLPRGGNITEGVTEMYINSTYNWRPLHDTEFSLGVVMPVSMTSEVLNSLEIPADYTFTYHRIDLLPPQKTCTNFGRLATKDTTVVKFAPDAFLDPYEYFGTDETEITVRKISDYIMDRSKSETHSELSLRGGIRDTVIATWNAEDVWLNSKTELTQYVIKRYIGTADGVFREIPGDVLSTGYDPRRRPWYYTALRHSGFLGLTTPYLDATGAGVVITAARTLQRGESSRIHNTNKEVLGVMGADFPLTYFYRLIAKNYPKCEDIQTYSCFVMDSAGFLVMHQSFMDPSATKHAIERVHIAEKEKHIAEDMISKGYLVKKECRNLEDVKEQTFYEVNLPQSGEVDATDNVGSCTKYQIGKITGTNAYLGISLRDPSCSQSCTCPSNEECRIVSCKCPCISSLDFHYCRGEFPNSSLPICPALAPDQSEVISTRKECSKLEKCFDPHCKEKSSQQTCDGIVSCYWCERDKDDVILSRPYCGSYEQCFRGKETPTIEDDEPNCGQAETDSDGLSPGAIAGISIGCIIIVAVVLVALYWGKRHYRLLGGMPNNPEADHPMSIENPDYSEIDDIKRESGSEPFTKEDLNIIPKPSESEDQLPSIPLKRKVSHQTSPPPAVPTTRRPSGAVETLAMGIFQQHPRKASVDSGRLNAYLQRQERRDSKPPLLPRARRPSELGEPSTSLPEENTPQAAISGHAERVYCNMQSSDPSSNHLPETNMPQTTIPQTILEQEEKPYGNVRPTVAKTPVESHDEGANDIIDDNAFKEFGNTSMAPQEAQQT